MNLPLFLVLLVVCSTTCNKYTKEERCSKNQSDGVCEKASEFEEDDDEPFFYEIDEKLAGREKLFKWDPIRKGYEREIDLGGGEVIKMVTQAIKPTVFIIDNFLTMEECDYIIDKSLHFGLSSSGLHVDDKIKLSKEYTYGQATNSFGNWLQWDLNGDSVVSKNEVITMAQRQLKLYLNSTDVDEIFAALKMTELDDGLITIDEFEKMNTAGIAEYMKDLREQHPRFRDRFSDQIWLKQDDMSDSVMKRLREKVTKLTNLPAYIIAGGEPLQVVRYKPFGHYHAHFDAQSRSEYPDYPCCHLDLASQPFKCRLCRFITVLYYLNDVEEGGETAFPVADKENYSHDEFKKRKNGDLYNLSEHCYNASLVVKSKKGRAVFWYNHHLEDGWLGEMDWYSLHGGCDIRKGIKWIANNWIVGPPREVAHMDSLYYLLNTPEAH
ncbi:transmembrane prolyl 4-hydroxylase-like [Hydra vulgaris]|uniref:Transmembrane prolyl 4-hydroxylase-like n=1 Tax=Hydra vulgaris TaxID=6087 RepID=A0ABM4DPF3_HYDVU